MGLVRVRVGVRVGVRVRVRVWVRVGLLRREQVLVEQIWGRYGGDIGELACCGESRFWSSSCAIDGPLFPSISYRVILPWKSMAGRCSVCLVRVRVRVKVRVRVGVRVRVRVS